MDKQYLINPEICFAEGLPSYKAEGKYSEVKGEPEEYESGLVKRFVSDDKDSCDIEYHRWPKSDAPFDDCIQFDIDGYNKGTEEVLKLQMQSFNEPGDSEYTFVAFPAEIRGNDCIAEISYFSVGNDYLCFELLEKTKKFYINNCGLSVKLPYKSVDLPKTKAQIYEDGIIFGSETQGERIPGIEIYTWERDGDLDKFAEYISDHYDLKEAVKTDIKLASGETFPGMKLRYYSDRNERSCSNIEWVLDLGERYASLRFEYEEDSKLPEAVARAVLASLRTDSEPIIFYQYFATTDLEDLQKRITKKFRETGHSRDIEFRTWVCDDDIPYKDGDIYTYDAFVLNFLVEEGYIRELPDIIDTHDVFPWIIDTTKVSDKIYGFPWLVCFDAVITRRKDYKNPYSEEDLKDNIVIPLGTYAPLYFYMASALSMERVPVPDDEDIRKRKSFEHIKRIAELGGGTDKSIAAHYKDPEVLEEFISGKKKYIAHFPEIVSSFPPDDYAISHLGYTGAGGDETKLYYVDFVSIGKNVREEKLLDCLDLAEILCSEEFIYELCAPDGKPSYMCPALQSLYPKLAELGNFYNDLYDVVKDPDNCTIRFKSKYYDFIPHLTERLLEALKSET